MSFDLPPIECEWGVPNCSANSGGANWGGHIFIPPSLLPPPMQTLNLGNQGGSGSGILQQIMQQITGQPATIVATAQQQQLQGCNCPGAQTDVPCLVGGACLAQQQTALPSANNIVEQGKAFATAHPFITLGIVGAIGYMFIKD